MPGKSMIWKKAVIMIKLQRIRISFFDYINKTSPSTNLNYSQIFSLHYALQSTLTGAKQDALLLPGQALLSYFIPFQKAWPAESPFWNCHRST